MPDQVEYLTIIDNFEDGDIVGWQTGGNANWVPDNTTSHEGSWSASNNDIGDSQQSWIKRTIQVSETSLLKFWWKVSSELSFDWLIFYVNDVEKLRTSGEIDWKEEIISLEKGEYEIKWVYIKDPSYSTGSDKGWIDYVTLFVSHEIIIQKLINLFRIGRSIISDFPSNLNKFYIVDLVLRSLRSLHNLISVGLVDTFLIMKWNLRSLITKSISSLHNVGFMISKVLISFYSSIGSLSKIFSIKFSLRNLANQTLVSVHMLRGLIIKTISLIFKLGGIISKILISQFNIRNILVNITKIGYSIHILVSKSMGMLHSIFSRVASIIRLMYGTGGFVSRYLISRWNTGVGYTQILLTLIRDRTLYNLTRISSGISLIKDKALELVKRYIKRVK